MKGAGLALLIAVSTYGCASQPVSVSHRYAGISAVELTDTPFFPQTKYQCGPAALATVLSYSGIDILPEALVADVYVPSKRGSLQVEMLAAARRHRRLAYVIPPQLESLLRELGNGRPVLVMQNLGWRRAPVWHYAVVIGFDPERDRVILRSGTRARRIMSTSKFLKTWRRSDSWGFVVVRADQFPASAERKRMLKAIAAMETIGDYELLKTAFGSFLGRWPDDTTALLGLGNAQLALGKPAHAALTYRRLLRAEAGHVAARNNLALALAGQGCYRQALAETNQAIRLNQSNPIYQQQLLDTRRDIEHRIQGQAEMCATDAGGG